MREIERVTYTNGKQVLFMGDKVWQRWLSDTPTCFWEPIDPRILRFTPIPRDAEVECFKG